MTSEKPLNEVYVWIWLPNEIEPVVAGLLSRAGSALVFNYGRSYLERDNAIPIYEPELPLKSGILPLPAGLSMPSSLRDAAPDAWGRRVIINRKFGHKGAAIDLGQLDELTYLIESGSDRIGALDFQRSATVYEPRQAGGASLDDLLMAAERVEAGVPILCGNTDDHARNHAAFWDGTTLMLTPAYDICPQGRAGHAHDR
jgi:serine/threonine-protein kinase HipA